MIKASLGKLILISAMLLAGTTIANAATPQDYTSTECLKHQGHSADLVNLIDLQKARSEGKELPVKDNRIKVGKWYMPAKQSKFTKDLFWKRDVTLPLVEFGHPTN